MSSVGYGAHSHVYYFFIEDFGLASFKCDLFFNISFVDLICIPIAKPVTMCKVPAPIGFFAVLSHADCRHFRVFTLELAKLENPQTC